MNQHEKVQHPPFCILNAPPWKCIGFFQGLYLFICALVRERFPFFTTLKRKCPERCRPFRNFSLLNIRLCWFIIFFFICVFYFRVCSSANSEQWTDFCVIVFAYEMNVSNFFCWWLLHIATSLYNAQFWGFKMRYIFYYRMWFSYWFFELVVNSVQCAFLVREKF